MKITIRQVSNLRKENLLKIYADPPALELHIPNVGEKRVLWRKFSKIDAKNEKKNATVGMSV